MPNKPGDITGQPTIAVATNAHSRIRTDHRWRPFEKWPYPFLSPMCFNPIFACGIYTCVYGICICSLGSKCWLKLLVPLESNHYCGNQLFDTNGLLTVSKKGLGHHAQPICVGCVLSCLMIEKRSRVGFLVFVQVSRLKKSLEHALSRLAPQQLMEARS